jgi:hypothetical protein
MREAKPWPASTGWLVVSILFANKLWISDVTSMSLYWVARLPLERPKEQTSSRGLVRKPKRVASAIGHGRSRQWKIALSLAIVGALAAPFVFRTYKARPTYSVWVPLTAGQKENLAARFQNPNYCRATGRDNAIIHDYICGRDKEIFELGGDYESYLDHPKYLAMNVGAAAATFVSVFSLAFLIPMLIRGLASLARRYWKWLNA